MLLSDYKCECGMTAEKKHRLTERPKVQCICGKFMVKQQRGKKIILDVLHKVR